MSMHRLIYPTQSDRGPGSSRAALDGRRAWRGLTARLAGPGGCYNLGNALCLGMSIALPVLAAQDAGTGVLAAAARSLVGNPGAVTLTLATGLFFWSGEVYHRAWANGAPPDQSLNRRGDLLTGLGCVVFAAAMLGLGQPVLVAAIALQAAGKFGSAAGCTTLPGWPAGWPDPFRTAVLVSRVPAIAAAAAQLAPLLSQPAGAMPWSELLVPLTLLVSYALWARADILLFQPAGQSGRDAIAATDPR